MVWKLSTLVFAVATLVLVSRDLTEPDRPVAGAATERPARTVVEAPAPRPGDSTVGEDGTCAEDGPAPDRTPSVETTSPHETPLELASRVVPFGVSTTLGSSPSKRLMAALEARKEEVLPILEGWLDRMVEISRRGGHVRWLPGIYARLAGRDGIARLEALAAGRHWSGLHAEALARIDDPAATAALVRLQEVAPENSKVVHLAVMAGTESGRQLLREWARTPPESQGWAKVEAQRALLHRGTEGDREEIWRRASPDERLKSLRVVEWLGCRSDLWAGRYRATVVEGLSSDDTWSRLTAAQRIVRTPDAFDETTLAALDALIEREVEGSRERARLEREGGLPEAAWLARGSGPEARGEGGLRGFPGRTL
jgi:hypothetical protein